MGIKPFLIYGKEKEIRGLKEELTKLEPSFQIDLAFTVRQFHDKIVRQKHSLIIASYNKVTLNFLKAIRIKGKSVPFIFLSSEKSPEVICECFRQGADDYLLKDDYQKTPDKLRAIIRENLEKHTKLKEKKVMEDELRETKNKLEIIFESVPDVIVVTDLKGKIQEISSEPLKSYCLSKEEIIGRNIADFIPQESKEKINRLLKDLLKTGFANNKEFTIIIKDQKIPIEFNVSMVQTTKSRPKSFIAIVRDISERKEIEESIKNIYLQLKKQNQILIKLDAMKNQFLSNVSHELCTPLTSVLGYLEIILDERAGDLNNQQKYFLTQMQKEGQVLYDLINNLIVLAEIKAGKVNTVYRDYCLGSFLQDIQKTVKPLFQAKEQFFIVSYSSSLAKTIIKADEYRIRLIILNLLKNASKFTLAKGTVTLKLKLLKNNLHIIVEDTGIGIRKVDQEIIFEAFNQVDSSLTKEYRGAGLGLTIVKKIVDLYSGKISLESKKGKGSCFKVTLPVEICKK